MKVLWVSLVKFKPLCEYLKESVPFYCGWMYSSAKALLDLGEDVELAVVTASHCSKMEKHVVDGITYYLLPGAKLTTGKAMGACSEALVKSCKEIVEDFSPDIIHLHGIEYSISAAMAKVGYNCPIVASIQGLADACARYVFSGVSLWTLFCNLSFRDILKLSPPIQEKRRFTQRGELGCRLLESISHVIGRTDWDYVHVWSINPDIRYYFCDETLRDSFYSDKWNYVACCKRTVFVSSSSSPLKGAHQVIKALPLVKRVFPDIQVRFAGRDVMSNRLVNRLKLTSYNLYLKRLVKKLKLEDNVVFLGDLPEERMKAELLSANVYVLPSAIENSPNSLCEAQILGVPCLAANSGGVANLIEEGKSGYMYRFDEFEILAYKLIEMLKCEDFEELSARERYMAHSRHDKIKNATQLFEIYTKLLSA